ncbi:MAG: hypothetical protein EBS87_12570 [Sphingomonadaceae bacterium]|nr:hypothetical protein [Sphingomonadaceae bacterium]
MAPHTGSVTKLPTPPKSSFASDNVAGAHPLVLDAIAQANAGHVPAYGASGYMLYAWRRMKGKPVSVIATSTDDPDEVGLHR